ncbi:two-component regulator propeller domain-containing protein [Pedobacter foliorum]|uniref:ligand-binding sensor domain-containing protein n=1 Tax=Pedobacter foliorum TaxID=2739058 RepID=UPI001C263917|nr:two-component regulator propeller domain-containing protein [Pedobacter foliorum]
MKNKRNVLYSLIIMLTGVIYFPVQAQQKNDAQDAVETKDVSTSQGPNRMVRTIKQDRRGNIWLASTEGIIRYDGKLFTNITSKAMQARFFSVLEDKKGNFWFASVGSGVYYYNEKSFKNYTTKDGLAGDQVTNIYEDKTGNVWFGTGVGASRYDGKSFQNFKMKEGPVPTGADSIHVSVYQHPIPDGSWMHNDVNSIIEDKTGKFWFGTRGYVSIYDGKTFTTVTNKEGKPFANVRSIIKDKKGNIWLGGYDGLWRYDGITFTNFAQKFVGNIYEDRKGNIWTSSESASGKGWSLLRYDGKTLSDNKPVVTEVKSGEPMIFGIIEAKDGSIWFGTVNGVCRYDGVTFNDFKAK